MISGLCLHATRTAKWTPQQKAQAAQIMTANPVLALAEIVREAVHQGLPRISPSTLHHDLQVFLITRKVMRTIPQMRNAPQTKLDRQLCCQWVPANQHPEFVYADEFDFEIGTQRHFGRAPRGQAARRITPLTKSANVLVCIAVSTAHGLIYHDFNYRAFDRGAFSVFMDSLAEEVTARRIANARFILNNCAIHNIEDVREASDMFRSDFNFLPPDSPMLNPIEGCIGDVKRAIQTAFATVLRPHPTQPSECSVRPAHQATRTLLLQVLTLALPVITPQLVEAH
jgi:hypothetical protein